jgi:hypothetical protein
MGFFGFSVQGLLGEICPSIMGTGKIRIDKFVLGETKASGKLS